MNVGIILSGGCGRRFGNKIPKQYLDLCGKPVIEYVVDSALSSDMLDEIVLVIDKEYLSYVEDAENERIHIVSNGTERLDSVKNGLDYIKANFPSCENIIILQAVSPFVTPMLIDNYLKALDEYDVVTTAEKCPGEIFNVEKYRKIKRDEYYFCNSPEAFKFNDLYNYIDTNSEYSELIYHYPNEPKIYFYSDFHHNVKLTYKADLDYAEFLMKSKIDANNTKL